MLKYICLLLISLTCMASEPKFHFMDCVKVVRGFYLNCTGTVEEFYNGGRYAVSINCKGERLSVIFQESDLESSKGCSK